MNDGKSVGLDVLFLLDATGNMADEIHRIKTTLSSIAQQVAGLPANPDIRFGMVAYRDRDDNYVTHIHPFDDRVGRFRDSIESMKADGGGDYPESLNQALHEAVNDMRWRDDAIRLVLFQVNSIG